MEGSFPAPFDASLLGLSSVSVNIPNPAKKVRETLSKQIYNRYHGDIKAVLAFELGLSLVLVNIPNPAKKRRENE